MSNKETWLVKTFKEKGRQDSLNEILEKGFYGLNLSIPPPQETESRDDYIKRANAFIKDNTESKKTIFGGQAWDLLNKCKIGDRLILFFNSDLVAKGTVVGSPKSEPSTEFKNFIFYSIPVKWTQNLTRIATKDTKYPGEGYAVLAFTSITENTELLKQIGERIDEDKSDSQEPEGELRKWEEFKRPANQPLNKILSGPPGTGKTFKTLELSVKLCDQSLEKELDRKKLESAYQGLIEQGRIEFITFHQTYDYSDFVQGIRPKEQNGGMAFEYYKGPLRRLADAAAMNYRQPGDILPYVLIIDEINRGNVSKIFGELITLIEEDKRGIHGHTKGLSVKLLYENDASKRFFLPPNLYIIGTMNTADRSVQRLDSALRRRFEFENIAPDLSLLEGHKNLDKLLGKINLRIFQELNDTGSQIGHAWFMNKGKVISEDQDILRVLNNKVIPLLIEWFWNQPDKLKKVLGNKSYNLVVQNGVNTELIQENLKEFIELS